MNLFVILFYNKKKLLDFIFCFVLCSFLLLHKWKSLVYLLLLVEDFLLVIYVCNKLFKHRKKNVKNAVELVVRCEDLKLFHGEFFPKEFFHQKHNKKEEGGKV